MRKSEQVSKAVKLSSRLWSKRSDITRVSRWVAFSGLAARTRGATSNAGTATGGTPRPPWAEASGLQALRQRHGPRRRERRRARLSELYQARGGAPTGTFGSERLDRDPAAVGVGPDGAAEEAGQWEEAASVFRQLRDRAEFTFQKREAGEGLARASLAQGDTAGAVQAYESILEALDPDHPQRPRYEMRLAELTAGSL